MTKKILFACMLLVACRTRAQSVSTEKELSEIVVTANRFPQKQINTGKILTVITRKEIEGSPASNVGELLNRQTGITVIGANNSPGSNPDVYMRGAGTGNALILMDGVPINDASTIRATFDLNFIPLGEIERIEILKGGQSTLYGSDAVAGVINIITKKNESQKLSPSIHLSKGSYGTNKADIGISGRNKSVQYKFQTQQLTSNGFSSAADTASIKTFDKDGLKQQFYRAELGSIYGGKWEWKSSAQLSKYKNELDETGYEDAKDSRVKNENLQVAVGLSRKLKFGKIHSNFSINKNQRNYLDDSTDLNGMSKYLKSDFKGSSYFAEIYGVFKLSDRLELFAAADNRWQHTDQYFFSVSNYGDYASTLSSDSAKINIQSFSSSIIYNGKKGLNIETGIRYNNHSRFGNNFTYTFNPSFVYRNKFKFSYNLSTAFKAPSLYQLYDGYAGEINLKPERSISNEVSIQLLGIKNINARATYFDRRIKNGIDYNYQSYKYFNNNGENDHGIEIETGYKTDKLNVSVNYTYLKGNVTTKIYEYDANIESTVVKGDTIYSHLFRVPKNSLNASAGYQLSKAFYISISQQFSGKRFEPRYADKPLAMKSYNTTDISLQYKMNKKIRLYITMKNIFDVKYQNILGFNSMGRNYVIGFRL